MDSSVIQFGVRPQGKPTKRPGAYVVAYNACGEILALDVNGHIHLPGGGIDGSESPELSARRELLEEAGCEITNIRYIGRANQFFSSSKIGPLNKLGVFYTAEISSLETSLSKEEDHRVLWITPEDFRRSNASEFQKWAVEQSTRLRK